MEKTLPLYLGPSVIGSVIIRKSEHHIHLFAKTYTNHEGLLRAYVRGFEGTLLIGVLAPDGTAFSAKKSLSHMELSKSKLTFYDISYAFAIENTVSDNPLDDRWQRLSSIPDKLCQNKITYSLLKSAGALANDDTTPSKIAVPLLTGNPFPRPDILCLLSPREIDGALYGILRISENGEPQRP